MYFSLAPGPRNNHILIINFSKNMYIIYIRNLKNLYRIDQKALARSSLLIYDQSSFSIALFCIEFNSDHDSHNCKRSKDARLASVRFAFFKFLCNFLCVCVPSNVYSFCVILDTSSVYVQIIVEVEIIFDCKYWLNEKQIYLDQSWVCLFWFPSPQYWIGVRRILANENVDF